MDILGWLAGIWSGVVAGWPGFLGLMGAEKAPWWGIPAVTAGATILGAIVAFTSTRASDRRKQKAEDARRYDEDIRKYCSKFLAQTDEYKKQAQEYNRLDAAESTAKAVDPKTGEAMLKSTIALRAQSAARKKASVALNQLEFIAPKKLHDLCLQLYVAAMRIDMQSLSDKATNDDFTNKRRIVRNELRRTIKLKPLSRKAPLRARIKRRIKNPKSFWTDYQKWDANRIAKSEAKKAAKEAKKKEEVESTPSS